MDMEDIEKDMEEIGETEEVRFFKYFFTSFLKIIKDENYVIIVYIISCENKVTLIPKVSINKKVMLKRFSNANFFTTNWFELLL